MAKNQKPGTTNWFDDDQTLLAPNPAAPKLARAKSSKLVVWWVMASAVLMPVLVLLNLGLITHINDAAPTGADTYTSTTRAVAAQSLNDWLGGDPAPIPAAEVLSWEGAETTEVAVRDGAPDLRTDLHTFAVSSGEARFLVTVTVAVQAGVPAVVGSPSFVVDPIIPVTVDENAVWGGRAEMVTNADLEEAVRTWSQAFLSGDPVKLRQAVGDPDLAATYVPLQGTTWIESKITQLASPSLATETSPNMKQAFGRVEIMYRFGPVPADAVTSSHPKVVFDVLIEAADTAAPRVVAWGGVSTAPQLERYGNAERLPEMVVVTPTPQPTEGEQAQPGTEPTEQEG